MKFEEGHLSTITMESFMAIMDELDKDRGSTKTELNFDRDNKSHIAKYGPEKTAFDNMRYRLYDIPGNHPVAKRVNQIMWPTSMKRVSIPSAMVQTACEHRKTQPSDAIQIFSVRGGTRNMQKSKCIATSVISKGNIIIRSTGSTCMTKAPKFAEKGFPNHRHFVLDTSLMKFEENVVEEILNTDKKLREIIEGATENTGKDRSRNDNNYVKSGLLNKDDSKKAVETKAVKTQHEDIKNDIKGLDIPNNAKVRKIESNIFEDINGEPTNLLCHKSVYTNLGNIAMQTDELMRYLQKSCRKIYQTGAIIEKIRMQETMEDCRNITDSEIKSSDIIEEELNVVEKSGHSDRSIKVNELDKRETDENLKDKEKDEVENVSSEIHISLTMTSRSIDEEQGFKASLSEGVQGSQNSETRTNNNVVTTYQEQSFSASLTDDEPRRQNKKSNIDENTSERIGKEHSCSKSFNRDVQRLQNSEIKINENCAERTDVDIISSSSCHSHNEAAKDGTTEDQTGTILHLVQDLEFGDDSMFGILGVYCRSELHACSGHGEEL